MSRTLERQILDRSVCVGVLGLGYVGLPLSVTFVRAGFCVAGFDIDPQRIESLGDKGRESKESSAQQKQEEGQDDDGGGEGGDDRDQPPRSERPSPAEFYRRSTTLSPHVHFLSNSDSFSAYLLPNDPAATPHDTAEALERCGVFIICVPTPLKRDTEGQSRRSMTPDLSYVHAALRSIATFAGVTTAAEEGHHDDDDDDDNNNDDDDGGESTLIVLESTSYPGTTEDLATLLASPTFATASGQARHRRRRRRALLAFSPEREDPGSGRELSSIPKLVGGVTARGGSLAAQMYRAAAFQSVVEVRSARVAEAAKLVENIYRNVNIALVNELKLFFQCSGGRGQDEHSSAGVDIHEVLDAAESKPFGFQRFSPGPGIGGHCIPIDPTYLRWAAQEAGFTTPLIDAAIDVNEAMPRYVAEVVNRAVVESTSPLPSPSPSRVILVGVAYKGEVDDCRESPAWPLWQTLAQIGHSVEYFDPLVPVLPAVRDYPFVQGQASLSRDALASCLIAAAPPRLSSSVVLVLVTIHRRMRIDALLRETEFPGIVVDTRGYLRKEREQGLKCTIKMA